MQNISMSSEEIVYVIVARNEVLGSYDTRADAEVDKKWADAELGVACDVLPMARGQARQIDAMRDWAWGRVAEGVEGPQQPPAFIADSGYYCE